MAYNSSSAERSPSARRRALSLASPCHGPWRSPFGVALLSCAMLLTVGAEATSHASTIATGSVLLARKWNNWTRVPTFFHACRLDREMSELDWNMYDIDKYDSVTFGKGQSLHVFDPPRYAEEKLVEACAFIKSMDPDMPCFFYTNMMLDWDYYLLHQNHLELLDSDKTITRMTSNGDRTFPNSVDINVFDVTSNSVRGLWMDTCVKATTNQVKLAEHGVVRHPVDGCFVDRGYVGLPELERTDFHPPKKLSLIKKYHNTRRIAGNRLLDELSAKVSPSLLVVNPGSYFSDLNDWKMERNLRGADIIHMERFCPTQSWIDRLDQVSGSGKLVQVHGGFPHDKQCPSCSEHLRAYLAAFLLGTNGPDSRTYFACHTNWILEREESSPTNEYLRRKEYDLPLGVPQPVVRPSRKTAARAFVDASGRLQAVALWTKVQTVCFRTDCEKRRGLCEGNHKACSEVLMGGERGMQRCSPKRQVPRTLVREILNSTVDFNDVCANRKNKCSGLCKWHRDVGLCVSKVSDNFYRTDSPQTRTPTSFPSTRYPTVGPTRKPTSFPSTRDPTPFPSKSPFSRWPTKAPTPFPTNVPTSQWPTNAPTLPPSLAPNHGPAYLRCAAVSEARTCRATGCVWNARTCSLPEYGCTLFVRRSKCQQSLNKGLCIWRSGECLVAPPPPPSLAPSTAPTDAPTARLTQQPTSWSPTRAPSTLQPTLSPSSSPIHGPAYLRCAAVNDARTCRATGCVWNARTCSLPEYGCTLFMRRSKCQQSLNKGLCIWRSGECLVAPPPPPSLAPSTAPTDAPTARLTQQPTSWSPTRAPSTLQPTLSPASSPIHGPAYLRCAAVNDARACRATGCVWNAGTCSLPEYGCTLFVRRSKCQQSLNKGLCIWRSGECLVAPPPPPSLAPSTAPTDAPTARLTQQPTSWSPTRAPSTLQPTLSPSSSPIHGPAYLRCAAVNEARTCRATGCVWNARTCSLPEYGCTLFVRRSKCQQSLNKGLCIWRSGKCLVAPPPPPSLAPSTAPTDAPTARLTPWPTAKGANDDFIFRPRWNFIIANARGVGNVGGQCTCPDGRQYNVGAYDDDCSRLACIGGESSGCYKRKGSWSKRKAICAVN